MNQATMAEIRKARSSAFLSSRNRVTSTIINTGGAEGGESHKYSVHDLILPTRHECQTWPPLPVGTRCPLFDRAPGIICIMFQAEVNDPEIRSRVLSRSHRRFPSNGPPRHVHRVL